MAWPHGVQRSSSRRLAAPPSACWLAARALPAAVLAAPPHLFVRHVQPQRVAHDVDGRHHGRVIVQRLAHAHEHDVGDGSSATHTAAAAAAACIRLLRQDAARHHHLHASAAAAGPARECTSQGAWPLEKAPGGGAAGACAHACSDCAPAQQSALLTGCRRGPCGRCSKTAMQPQEHTQLGGLCWHQRAGMHTAAPALTACVQSCCSSSTSSSRCGQALAPGSSLRSRPGC